jgi:ligand-binding sensor domain-containing protein
VHADGWRVMDVPGRPIGTITAMAEDAAGLWVAGSEGVAFFDPSRPLWNALIAPGDVPHPVRDVVASRDHVWVATDIGLVRYARRVLTP